MSTFLNFRLQVFHSALVFTQKHSTAGSAQQCVCESIYGRRCYQQCHPSPGSPPTTEILTNCFRWHGHTHIHTRVNFWQALSVAPGRAFSPPTTPLCFIVHYPRSVTCISVPVFLWNPTPQLPSVLSLDRKEVPVSFECDSAGKSVSCLMISIEGRLSTRILNLSLL